MINNYSSTHINCEFAFKMFYHDCMWIFIYINVFIVTILYLTSCVTCFIDKQNIVNKPIKKTDAIQNHDVRDLELTSYGMDIGVVL